MHKGYVYNADHLKHIKNRGDYDRKLRILDYKACVNIRKFMINWKKIRRGRKVGDVKCYESKPRSVNFDKPIPVAWIQESKITKFTKQLKFVTLNAQSIKNNDQLIVDYLLNEHIDVAIITETWFKDTDDIWLQGCELNKNGYKITSSNRKIRQGGGVVLVYKDSLIIKMLIMDQTDTFEKGIWQVRYPGVGLTVCVIYHPPYSETYQVTHNQFQDEFSEFLAEVLVEHRNLMITGDFNLHVNDSEDQDGEVFTDTMLALGLDQHVMFPTHRSNNTLDLVFTEYLSTHRILSCKPGPYLSDHKAVEFLLSVEKEHMFSKHITIRKLKFIDIPSLIEDLQLDDQLDSDKLDDMVDWLETRLWTALDKDAPSKEKCITVRSSTP